MHKSPVFNIRKSAECIRVATNVDRSLYSSSAPSSSSHTQYPAEPSVLQPSKRIRLAPGSKLALKFPHHVQEDVATKGGVFGAETPGATSVGRDGSRLQYNM